MSDYLGKHLFLLTSLNQGGAETYLLRFLKFYGMPERTGVLCTSGSFGVMKKEFLTQAEIFSMRIGVCDLRGYWRLYRFIARGGYSSICDFTGNFSGFPLLCARLAGVKIRIAQYRGAEDHFKRTLLRCIYNWGVKQLAYYCSTKIISNSKAAFDYFYPGKWKDNTKFQVIYNGVNINALLSAEGDRASLRKEFKVPENAFVVGHTGRCNYAKNHDTIIEVAIRLCKKHPSIYFFLVGIDVDKMYGERVRNEGLASRILLPGYRNDVPRLLYLMDLFYFPSVTEGQPNSLLEAEIVGLPIVASDIPPIAESVPPEFVEKLIPARDIDKAVGLIEKLYKDKSLREGYVCSTWARAYFDSELRFREFKEVLECN